MEEQINSYHNEELPEIRIILLGPMGSGKSSLGNRILGSKCFKSYLSSGPVTKSNQTAIEVRLGKRLRVTDTAAIDDLTRTNEEIAKNIAHLAANNQPGPHCFLLTIPVGPSNPVFKSVIRRLPEIFGMDMLKYTILVFTKSSALLMGNMTLEEFIRQDTDLSNFVASCFGYISVDNYTGDISEITQLMEKIENLVLYNNEQYYDQGCFRFPARVFEEKIRQDKKKEERKIETIVAKTVETRLQKLEQVAERHTRAINQLTVQNSDMEERLPPKNDQKLPSRMHPYDRNVKK